MRLQSSLALGCSLCLTAWVVGGPAARAQSADATAPPILVAATAEVATATVHLSGVDQPAQQDLTAGLLVNPQDPGRRIVPPLKLVSVNGAAREWDVTVEVGQIIPFGANTVPLLYRGEPKATLRFHKAGLTPVPPSDGWTAEEGHPLVLVLKNETAAAYNTVRMRLRFQDVDVCYAEVQNKLKQESGSGCMDASVWTSFQSPRYSSVTLHVQPHSQWFRETRTGLSRKGKRQGTLTLQFLTAQGGPVYEQNLPLEVQFEPGAWSSFVSMFTVFSLLLIGALLAILLRVVIPNYRRKKDLKARMAQLAKLTRGISDEAPSVLRVLLRVERLALDELRRSGWLLGLNFAEEAQRVEQGLDALRRKVELTRQLDNALTRKSILERGVAPPTRLDAIERCLSAATEILMRDQMTEQDRVFVQQKLDSAQRLLGEPTPEEREAFDSLLSQRWTSVAGFFMAQDGTLQMPAILSNLKDSFPHLKSLPQSDDKEGTRWVKEIGAARADLLLSALEIMRDLVALLPATGLQEGQWKEASPRLCQLLSSPAADNLRQARRLIQQLAQRVSVEDLIASLKSGEAIIESDPQSVSVNERARFRIRFRSENLQNAIAKQAIACEWEFADQFSHRTWRQTTRKSERKTRELGWEVYHYFEPGVDTSPITIRFFHDGKPVTADNGETFNLKHTVKPEVRLSTRKTQSEGAWQIFPEVLQIFAALAVPLFTLALTQSTEGTASSWWQLIGIGFGSDTVRNVLSGSPAPPPPSGSAPPK